jgi:hypothetical protein
MREALGLGVDHEVDAALLPARDRFRLVHAGLAETQAGDEALERGRRRLVERELDELDAGALRRRRQRRQRRDRVSRARPQAVEQVHERALAVDRDAARRAGAELVVEDLEREPALVAGFLQRGHEVEHREVALAREVAVVAAPGEVVHVDLRRVGDLDEEDAVARDRADRAEIGAAREDVKRVEHEPDGGMVGAAHRLPRVAIVVDVAAPGERLEADAQAALRRALAELAQIGRRAVDAAEAVGRDVGADEQQVGAELLHQVELALGAGEGAGALRGRHALEIAEGLQRDDGEAEFLDHAAHGARRAVEGEEIVLEDLDALEARGRDRRQLLVQGAAQRNRRDRSLHASLLVTRRPAPCRARRPPRRTRASCARGRARVR